jgi:hypothetical protein
MMGQPFFQRAARRLDKNLASLFFMDQWVIMTAHRAAYHALRWSQFEPLMPDMDRYWGDPFVLQRAANYFVFVEEKIYETGRGRIACLTLDGDGRLLSHQVVLERDYHLSYPFVFEHQGETFMIPETARNGTVELYRCLEFPGRWELVKTLMTGLYAVDATLLAHDGKHWLFANVKGAGASSLDALHLFWADSPFAEEWIPHPHNPVVKNIGSARPAGRIFVENGRLIRPSQDSSRRYGYSLKFNHITKLTAEDYEETVERTFEPPPSGGISGPRRPGGRILATHTFNQAGDLTVIDAVVRRRK